MGDKTEKLRRYRGLFHNPSEVESLSDVADLSARMVKAMAEIYATGGQSSGFVAGDDELSVFVAKMVEEEQATRRFDHRFMGQIHPHGFKGGVLANLMAALMNTNTIVKEVSKSEHAMEVEATSWLLEMFGFNGVEGSGNITSGWSTANLAALWAARTNHEAKLGVNEEDESSQKWVVLTNGMRHYSIDKSAKILGMKIKPMPMAGYKVDVEETRHMLERMRPETRSRIIALVGVAGETETGAVDNLDGLAQIAADYGLFYHVDAAYGGPFVLTCKRDLFKGIERADSITIDPHKMLYTPYPAGAVLFRDRTVHALIQNDARYLDRHNRRGLFGPDENRNFGLAARIEGSMGPAGVLSTWATMKLLGNDGVSTILEHTLDLASFAYGRAVESPYFRPLHKPDLNEFLVGLKDPEKWGTNYGVALANAQAFAETAGYYISFNDEVDEGRAALRFIAVHPWTTEKEVGELFDLLEQGLPQ